MNTILKIISTLSIWFFANATWIGAIVNFLWLLVKDVQLFSWWYIFWFAFITLISIVGLVISIIKQ